jgi:hypothetical protein
MRKLLLAALSTLALHAFMPATFYIASHGTAEAGKKQVNKKAAPQKKSSSKEVKKSSSKDVKKSSSKDVNVTKKKDVDVNVKKDVDVDVDIDNRHRDDDYFDHPVAAVTTAVVVGAVVVSLPSGCTTVIVNGITYQQCGSTWYAPRYSGSNVNYVVVTSPR